MEVYIHIGTEKTGTTSLQNFFQINRQRLYEEGVCYPEGPGKEKHFSLSIFCRENSERDDLNIRTGLDTEEKITLFKKEFPERLEKEVSEGNRNCQKLILSSEHLSSRLYRKEELQRLKELVKPYSDKPKIIVYLRRQDDYLISSYSTYVKSGGREPFRIPGENKSSRQRYDYYHILKAWKEVFGKENMMVGVYDEAELVRGDIIEDFLFKTGIQIRQDYRMPERRNGSLDPVTLEYLRMFNKDVPHIAGNRINPFRADILKVLSRLNTTGKAHAYDPEELSSFYSCYEISNRKVAVEYLDRDGDLFRENSALHEGVKKSNEVTVEELMEVGSGIWMIKQQEVQELKKKVKHLEMKLSQRPRPAVGFIQCIKRALTRMMRSGK